MLLLRYGLRKSPMGTSPNKRPGSQVVNDLCCFHHSAVTFANSCCRGLPVGVCHSSCLTRPAAIDHSLCLGCEIAGNIKFHWKEGNGIFQIQPLNFPLQSKPDISVERFCLKRSAADGWGISCCLGMHSKTRDFFLHQNYNVKLDLTSWF